MEGAWQDVWVVSVQCLGGGGLGWPGLGWNCWVSGGARKVSGGSGRGMGVAWGGSGRCLEGVRWDQESCGMGLGGVWGVWNGIWGVTGGSWRVMAGIWGETLRPLPDPQQSPTSPLPESH